MTNLKLIEMKYSLLFGFLLLYIVLAQASGFVRNDSPVLGQFAPDSTYLSKLPFSSPTEKSISEMIKTGLNLQELANRKSIILWDGKLTVNYIPTEADFLTDQEEQIYVHFKLANGMDSRMTFNFVKKKASTPIVNSNPYNWKRGTTGLFAMNRINTINSNKVPSTFFFSIFPPIFFSTVHQDSWEKNMGNGAYVTVQEKTWYQMICMPTLEDLIKVLDEPTKQKVIDYIFSNKNKIDFAYCLRSPSIKFAIDEIAYNQVKPKAIVFYAKEISQELAKSTLFAPKDEFESQNAYQDRQKKADDYKNEIQKKYTVLFKDFSEQRESDRIEKIKNSYSQINLNIAQIGTYNTEKQIFPITIEGLDPLEVNVPLQEAKSFKENLKNVKVIAAKQLKNDATSYQFFNIEITHPITGSKYTLLPSTPLYLDYVSKNMAVDGVPKLDATVKFIEPSGNNLLDGDEMAKFEVTIKNAGTGTAQNIKVNLSTIENNGFTFDKTKSLTGIAPNQSQTVIFEVNADRKINSKEIPFKFDITESRGFNPAEILYAINSQAFKTPYLAVKDIGIKEVTGNNNSIIENGEKIEVSVLVQNTGQGKTENTKAVFDLGDNNLISLSPDKMVQNVGELNPGESRLLTFDFTVNNIYKGTDLLPIKVVLSEKYNEYGGTFPLKLEMKKVQLAAKNIKISGQYDQKIEIKDISLTAETDKNIPETGAKNPYRFALIIGNEDYKSFQPDLNSEVNVLFAENDARTLREYAVKTLGVPEINITLLINATAAQMNQALAKMNGLAKKSMGKAELIFYYAGHGLPDENTKEPYLIPVDVSGANFLEGGIKLKTIYAKLIEFPSKKVSVFIDACFSGGARNQGLLSARAVKIKPKESTLTGNIVVFSASNGEQSSLPYQDKQHGMFTYFLLKKIQETKGDISLKELSDYISEQVSLQSVNINNKEQTPVINAGTDSWGNWTLR